MKEIKNRFHLYKTKESFKVHRKQGLINPDSICFIEETHQIYTQGSYYSPSLCEFEAIKEAILEHEAKLNNIIGIEGHSVDDGIVNNMADIIDFLDGFTDQDNLKDYIDSKLGGGGFTSRKLSEKEISALTGMEAGDIVYDTTNNVYRYYNGSAWLAFSDIEWKTTN